MGVHESLTGAERVAKRRATLRAQGLRPRQIWLPDLRDSKVRARIQADANALAAQSHRWNDLLDDVEGMAGEVLDGLPPYDWGDDPRGKPKPAAK
jgi:Protein  of unknown function (DUF3018)